MRRLKWWIRGVGQRLFPKSTLLMLANRTWLLEPEIELLPLLSERRNLAIDAGANKGVYLFHLARHFQQVLAFEPLPAMAAYLKRAAPDNVRVEACALSREQGEGVLRLPAGFNELASLEAHADGDWPSATELEEHHVRLTTLDALGLPDVDLIKIDVEGHELAVLEGARATIERCRPALLIEIEERHAENGIAVVEDYLRKLGYSGYFLDGAGIRPMSLFDAAGDQDLSSLRQSVRVARYVNNFIFLHQGELPRRVELIENALSSRPLPVSRFLPGARVGRRTRAANVNRT